VGGNFVKVALGRDYSDVPPNKGRFTGRNVKERMEVAVVTEELEAIPPELAAERVQSLPVPVFPEGRSTLAAQELVAQQQDHQQQQ
jgi:hypothetical protein